ncbi:MAG: TonB-dependent receptor [Pyrinomonadaceae bacterium]
MFSLRQLIICAFVLACALVTPAFAQDKSSTQTLRIEGVVMDQSGATVAGAQLSLMTAPHTLARTKTDEHGRFVFETEFARDVVLIASASGFGETTKRFILKAGETARIEIVLAPAPLAFDVAVTATRTEKLLGDTPSSVVMLSTAELSTTAAVTLDDALRQVPGFTLFRRSGSRTANPTTQGVSLRGMGASGASRAVTLVDGVPLNDPFGGWVYWSRVPREAVSRVEVLRGGASNLYGSGALGGVVQIITRKTEQPALSLEASYGNERTPDASLYASHTMNGWSARLAAETFRTDGYILVDKDERGPVDTPAGSRHAALDLTIERQIKNHGRVFVRGNVFGESRANGTPLQTNRTHVRQLIAGSDYQSQNAGAFTARAYGSSQVYDQNFSAVSADRNSETLTRVQRVPAQVFGVTAQWSRAVGDRHAVVAGLDASEVRGASDEIVFVQSRPSSLVGAGGRERSLGIFALDIIRITPRLFLNAGVRVDHWRNFAAQSASRAIRQNATATVNAFPDREETAWSPQFSVLYKPAEKVSVNAAIYRAFRAPTLNELYRSFRVGDVLTLANENLRAERLTGGEAGVSVAPFNRRLNMRATLFWTEITRAIANVTLTTTPALITRQRQNLGSTRSRGFEFETDARLGEYWSIAGGYMFVDATVKSFPANTALEGLLIPQVARHQLTFQTRYTNPSLLTFSLQGRATGAQFDDDQNRFLLQRYFTLDAFVSRRINHSVELFIAAENLFNERYEAGRTPVTTLGPPLLVRAGFRLRLGAQ